MRDVVLPVAQGAFVTVIDLDPIEKRRRPGSAQPIVQVAAEGAEVVVVAIAQCQHAVGQAMQRSRCAHGFAAERRGDVRRIALAHRAHYEENASGLLQHRT